MMNTKKIIELVNKCNFHEGTATAYVESNGKCIYCDKDLLGDLIDYYAADIDHLLPKSKYPQIASDTYNWVLSCKFCNLTKGKMDIPTLPWSASDAIKYHKKELIDMFRILLQQRRNNTEAEFNMAKGIIR